MATPIQKPNGSWTVMVKFQGQRARVTADTPAQLRVKAAATLVEMGGRLGTTNATVVDLLTDYLSTPRCAGWAPRYAEDMDRVMQRLPESFLAMPVASVETEDIDALYEQMQRPVLGTDGRTVLVAAMSAHRMQRLHGLLLPAFQRAVKYRKRWGLMVNPAADTDVPIPGKPDIRPPTPDEAQRILAAVEGTVLGTYVQLAAVAGARRGEMVALKWQDLDGQTLKIHRAASWTPRNDDATWQTGLVIKEVKTGEMGERNIALPKGLADELAALRRSQIEARLANGLGGSPEWIFSHDQGVTGWRPDYATDVFMQLRDDLGIDGVRLHDMRHFVATQLLAKGVPMAVVAHRLGDTVATVSRKYSRYTLAEDQAAADIMERILDRG